MKKKILFILPYPHDQAPSQRLKFEQYYNFFRDDGFEITYKPFINESFWKVVYKKGYYLKKAYYTILAYFKRYLLLLSINKYDVVYIHLWGTPFGMPLYEWLLSITSKKLIYDIDDLIYTGKSSVNNDFTSIFKTSAKAYFLMKHAHHVITCTPYLDEIAKNYNQNTTDISSTINTETYIPVNVYTNSHKIIIGWSGSHTTSQYLYLLTEILQNLKERIDYKLLVIGDSQFNIPGIDVEAIPWSREEEIPSLQKIDIGLYPLPLDDEWVLGKSGLKALQYMALGIPTIATDIGCNDRVIENGISGFLVKTQQEWLEKLKLLCNRPALRKKIGEVARQRVEKYFSVKSNAQVYLDILNKVLNMD